MPRPREGVTGLRSHSTLAGLGLDWRSTVNSQALCAPQAGAIPLLSMLPASVGTPQSIRSQTVSLQWRHLECCDITPPSLISPSVSRSHLKGHLLREPSPACPSQLPWGPGSSSGISFSLLPSPPFLVIHSPVYFLVECLSLHQILVSPRGADARWQSQH